MEENKFIMKEFEKKPAFSGFLPGIAGIHGIPIWCFYVNRGQAVVSFGVEDKDHAIMEFFPAHQAYQNVARQGFRTFVRCAGAYTELFAGETDSRQMQIGMNSLLLQEEDRELGLHTSVEYFTLPEERVGALIRKLQIRNDSEQEIRLEVLDGMPALIPYGVDMGSVKSMGQTCKAWMQAEDVETGVPYFRVRASMGDTACVTSIEGGNFSLSCDELGNRLPVLVDPSLVFGYDTSLAIAAGFREEGLSGLLGREQVTMNQYPCCFFGCERTLKSGEVMTVYQIVGQVADKKRLARFLETPKDAAYFEYKRQQSIRLTEELGRVMDTKTASGEFDAYSRYTYMDNVLRGGFPIKLSRDKIFHVYSRKHGDLERDYNYFRMLPEFYSQGNGNFRDVNQNRRCDPFFTPYVGAESIIRFYSLIQLDGYNPLAVEKVTYTLDEEKADSIFDLLGQEQKEELLAFLSKPFTPGQFFSKLEEQGIWETEEAEEYFGKVMEQADSTVNADFGEGYWSDHWTYNLDLVENYLSIFPEKEEELLFDTALTWYRQQAVILPRRKRYARTDNGLRQYQFLDHKSQTNQEKLLHGQYGKGEPVKATLMEKLIVLCTVKYAALDAYGMGVEMEGGKPGWYDALNGMPGVFGSSMAETYELARMLTFTIQMLEKYPCKVELLAESAQLLERMDKATQKSMNDIIRQPELIEFWNSRNDAKEDYWERTYAGISGARTQMEQETLLRVLKDMFLVVRQGIRKACAMENGICPTYFTYEVTDYSEDKDGIYPEHFEVKKVPLFLEGPVRYLKLDISAEEKETLYENIKNSDIYDEALQMYKVNASLENASYELGRARAFTPGWLENESVWLHMEYKYLLELLKSGLYKEYAEDFHKAGIPFLDPEVYGRSTYENSSFIASSKNPNKAYHGRGFVARLSGSTAEFLQMWILMMFGNPFRFVDGELRFTLSPVLPAYLVGEGRRVEAVFMGSTKVIYELADNREYYPGGYEITQMQFTYCDGNVFRTEMQYAQGGIAEDVRSGRVKEIRVKIR